MTYDPVSYWRERGATYQAKFQAEHYREQEAALEGVLRELEFAEVLEVGCGFGRIGELVRRVRPGAAYTGIDLSPAMLEQARDLLLEDAELIETSLQDFRPGTRKWDLVIAVEVLMHIPPEGIEQAIRKLMRLSSRHVVTLDWTTPLPRKRISAHNFLHDYDRLLRETTVPASRWYVPRAVRTVPVGLQTIHVLERP